MTIEKITIKNFGKINDFTLDFSEGINVIEGPNESGKSTIAAFIKYMLYGFDTPAVGAEQNSGRPDERNKRISGDSNDANGSMIVRVQDHRYLISRSTVPTEGVSGRIVYKEDASIVDMETGSPVFGKLPAGEVFFGVDRSLFENTAFIGQIGEAGFAESSVKESIENILFSGNEKINTQRAIAKLREKATNLRHEGNTGGLIFDLTKQKEKLETNLREIDEANRLILIKEAELHEIRKKRDEADRLREKLLDADVCYNNVMLIQTFDRLHELEKECEEKVEAYTTFISDNACDGYVPRESYLDELLAAKAEKKRAQEELADCEERYRKEKNAVGITKEIENAIELCDKYGSEDELKQRAVSLHGGVVRHLSFTILAAACAIAALAVGFAVPGLSASVTTLLFAACALGVVCTGLFGVLALGGKKRLGAMLELLGVTTYQDLLKKLAVIAEARAKRDGIVENTDRALSERNHASEVYDRSLRDLSVLVARFGGELPAEDVDGYLDGFIDKVRAFIAEQNRLFDDKTNSEITVSEIRRTLSSHSEIDVRAKVSPLKRKVLLGANHENITSGIAGAKADIASLDKLAADKENELADLKFRAGDPSEIYSRIQVLERKIEEQEAKFKAYGIAVKAIETAEEKLRAEISPRLGAYATDLVGIMTNKKYTDIDVSDGLRVSFLYNGEKKSVDFLSGGTRDMTYIAVRLALVDMLYTENPPLCFDESFAHQDNLRARAMMEAVAHLSDEKGQQSFIFTCNSRESTLATNLRPDSAIYKLTSKKNA